MEEQLTGTIEKFDDGYGFINADNGDLYYFRSKRKCKAGVRVVFETLNSPLAFELALIGGPIPAVKVKRWK